VGGHQRFQHLHTNGVAWRGVRHLHHLDLGVDHLQLGHQVVYHTVPEPVVEHYVGLLVCQHKVSPRLGQGVHLLQEPVHHLLPQLLGHNISNIHIFQQKRLQVLKRFKFQ